MCVCKEKKPAFAPNVSTSSLDNLTEKSLSLHNDAWRNFFLTGSHHHSPQKICS